MLKFLYGTTKCYVHIGAHAQAPNPGTKSGRGLSLDLVPRSYVLRMIVKLAAKQELSFMNNTKKEQRKRILAVREMQPLG